MRHRYWSLAVVVAGAMVWVGGTAVRGEPEAGAGKAIQVDEAMLRAAIGEETQRVAGVMERRLRKVEVELADAREAVRLLAADHARLVRSLQGNRAGGTGGGGGAGAERQAPEVDQRLAALGGQLATLRAQISVYAQQHGGRPPTLAQLKANWGVLTSTTDVEGNIGKGDFGPYINTVPRNALTGKSGVAGGNEKLAADIGWAYDEDTGAIWAVVPKGTPVNAKDVVFAE